MDFRKIKMMLPIEMDPPGISSGSLKKSDSITFDPLGVAAILPNPRATTSAVRLYTQYPRDSLRWPHLMMIGGTLAPLGVLVEHVLAHNRSMHPAMSMVQQQSRKLPVRSTLIFKEFPMDFSTTWIDEALNYRPSDNANNDVLVVDIDGGPDADRSVVRKLTARRRLTEGLFLGVAFFTGLVLVGELAVSVLLGDIWAAVLFFVYSVHWAASTLISFTHMVGPRELTTKIVEDGTINFAVYERKEGGTVVFRGRKDEFEAWFRRTWQLNQTPWNMALHWMWIVSGAAAAVASTVAMVNMVASLQLGFLGVLLFCSIMELGLTRLSRTLDMDPRRGRVQLFGESQSRSEAIVRTFLEARENCRLDQMDWIGMGLLPDFAPFVKMQEALVKLSGNRNGCTEEYIAGVIREYNLSVPDIRLSQRISGEVEKWARKCLLQPYDVQAKSQSQIKEEQSESS